MDDTEMRFRGTRNHLFLFAMVCVALQVLTVIHNSMTINTTQRNQENIIIKAFEYPVKRKLKKITVAFNGRMGNRMFEYASMLGIARRNNLTAVVPKDFDLFKSFDLKADTYKDNDMFASKPMQYYESKGCTYESGVMGVGSLHDVMLYGYFQSWKYFHVIDKEIRENFQWKKSIREMAMQQLGQLTESSKAKHIIGVHVRRGDMAHAPQLKKFGYVTAEKDYLERAMNFFRDKFQDVFFVVTSDDITWCRHNIFGYDVAFVKTDNSPDVDMAILAMCNHTVITTGSFGWWSAWLTGGEVVYYKDYPRRNSTLSSIVNLKDYWPPSWIAM